MQPSTIEKLNKLGLYVDQSKLTSLAESREHTIRHNDIVVLGSDGVFDNLFDA